LPLVWGELLSIRPHFAALLALAWLSACDQGGSDGGTDGGESASPFDGKWQLVSATRTTAIRYSPYSDLACDDAGVFETSPLTGIEEFIEVDGGLKLVDEALGLNSSCNGLDVIVNGSKAVTIEKGCSTGPEYSSESVYPFTFEIGADGLTMSFSGSFTDWGGAPQMDLSCASGTLHRL
jgi:hypothetical protein